MRIFKIRNFTHKIVRIKNHPRKKWVLSLTGFENTVGKKFKVTRRIP